MSYLNGFVSFIQSFPQHNPIADDWQAAKELLRHLKRAGNETYRLTLFRSASNIDAFVDGLVLLSKIAPQGSKVSPLTETLSLLCSLCRIARHRTRLAADLDFVTALAYRIVSTDDSLWMDQFLILMKSVSADSLSCFVYPPPQITSLLSALVTTITSEPDHVQTLVPLAVFGNIIRNNMGAKSSVKSLPSIQNLYRILIKLLSNQHMGIVLHSLRALTTLAINDPLEKKLFNSANIQKTFQMVFNLIINGYQEPTSSSSSSSSSPSSSSSSSPATASPLDPDMLQAAIHLLSDIIKSVDLLASLESYSELEPSLRQVLRILIAHDDPQIAIPILQLLQLLVRSAPLQKVIFHVILVEDCLPVLLDFALSRHLGLAMLATKLIRSTVTTIYDMYAESPDVRSHSAQFKLYRTRDLDHSPTNQSHPALPSTSVQSLFQRLSLFVADTDVVLALVALLNAPPSYFDSYYSNDNCLDEFDLNSIFGMKPFSTSSSSASSVSSSTSVPASSSLSSSLSCPMPCPPHQASSSSVPSSLHPSKNNTSPSLAPYLPPPSLSARAEDNAVYRYALLAHLYRLINTLCRNGRFRATLLSQLRYDQMTSLIAHELRSQRGPNAFSLIRILLSFKREIPLKIKVFFKALGQDLPAIGLMGKAVSSTDKEDVADGLCFMKQLFSNDHSRHSGGSSSDSGDEKGSRDNPTGADVYDDRIDLTSDHGNSVMMQNIVDGLNHFNQQDRRDVDLLAEQVCGLTASNRKYQSILEKGYDDLKERDQSQIQVMRKYELEMKALSDSSRNQLRAKEDIIAQLHKTHKRQTSMLEERISQIQGLLTSKEEALQAAYTTSKQHRERTLILQAELSESAQRTANLEGKVKEMAKHTTEKDEELQDAETRVKIHSTASEQLKLQLEVSHKNLKGAKDQYVSLQKKNKQKGKHLEEVYQKLIIVTKAFQEKTTEFVKLESAKAELSELLDDARERILEMEEAHASRSSELQDAHSRCESLESNLADRTAVIDTLQSNIDSVTRDNRELEGTAMKQEQQVKALKLASERLTHALKEREAEVESHQNLLQQKEKQLEQHSTLTAMIHNLTLKAPANENGGGDSNTSMRRM